MALRVVGAGMPRTGTTSLKAALEQLLGGRCYHMMEVFARPEDVPVWHAAVRGDPPDWQQFFDGWTAAIDWPASAFWPELVAAFPDAIVVLSLRDDPETWYRSADRTVFDAFRHDPPPGMEAWAAMAGDLVQRFVPGWDDADTAMATYEAHNEAVRAAVAPERMVEWRASQGWSPLCAALGLPVPDDDFPVRNTTAEFRAMTGWDA